MKRITVKILPGRIILFSRSKIKKLRLSPRLLSKKLQKVINEKG